MTDTPSDFPGVPPIEERYDLRHLTTFVQNKRLPIHNWFYFKEGFARGFVEASLKWMGVDRGTILDPFVGVGTTTLTSRELGLDSIGIDASPLMVLVSRAKCEDQDIDLLEQQSSKIFATRFERPDLSEVSSGVRRFFSKYVLEDVIFFRSLINSIEDGPSRDFFLVMLMSSAMKASYALKDGAVLRVTRRPTPPFRRFFRSRVKRAIKELKRFTPLGPEPSLHLGDARQLDFLADSSVDCIVTSPPYLNKIEYTKVYEIEYSLFLRDTRPAPIRSYIGSDAMSEEVLFPSLPPIANAYFVDMKRVLSEMHRVLKEGSTATILVAGGVFPTGVVESDIHICALAGELGLRPDRIIALNKRVATRDRVVRIGWARESAIMLSK